MSESWLGSVRQRLDSFTKLKPDWDSYGACEISVRAIFAARIILTQLAKAGTSEPFIAPTVKGYVELEWEFEEGPSDERFLTATILPTGTICYGWWSDAENHGDNGTTSDWRDLLRFMPKEAK